MTDEQLKARLADLTEEIRGLSLRVRELEAERFEAADHRLARDLLPELTDYQLERAQMLHRRVVER